MSEVSIEGENSCNQESGDEPPDDFFSLYGLKRIELVHKPIFDDFFKNCRIRLSDYTFANTFIWKDSIHLRWKIIDNCLCVFANGCGGLTLLFPPIGTGNFESVLENSISICMDFNKRAKFSATPRIEYVSDEFLQKFGKSYGGSTMSGDYIYETKRMIDLSGKDLASKRHAKNQFMKKYSARTEKFSADHKEDCISLLTKWCQNSEQKSEVDGSINIKRSKEIIATIEAIKNFENLGLTGMVLYADNKLIGFTFGEMLDKETCSIVIEKTDRDYSGSAQYIFSEFCRQFFGHTKWCNAGDDWEIPSLAWTKQSYRPAFRVGKWVVSPIQVRMQITAKALPL